MRDNEIVVYDDLEAGQPKALLRFYFLAKGETRISKYPNVASQVDRLP